MTDDEAMALSPENYPILHVYPKSMDVQDRIGRNGLEKRLVTAKAFNALKEYSCSIPSGVFYGKAWKCDRFAYVKGKPKGATNYVIGRYERIPGDDKKVSIKWYDVEII